MIEVELFLYDLYMVISENPARYTFKIILKRLPISDN